MSVQYDYQWARPYIDANDRIKWTGRPESVHLFTNKDAFMIPFSIVWFGFALFWEIGVIQDQAPLMFIIVGGAFLVIGLYITVGRFVHKLILLRNTAYVITEKVLLCNQFGRVHVTSLPITMPVDIIEYKDGTGTIIMGHSQFINFFPFSQDSEIALECILRPQYVMSLLLNVTK